MSEKSQSEYIWQKSMQLLFSMKMIVADVRVCVFFLTSVANEFIKMSGSLCNERT